MGPVAVDAVVMVPGGKDLEVRSHLVRHRSLVGVIRALLCVGCTGVLGGRVVDLGGGIMIPRASSWAWKFGGARGNGGLLVGEACNEVVPIFFVAGFVDPVLEGAILSMVNSGTFAKIDEGFSQ